MFHFYQVCQQNTCRFDTGHDSLIQQFVRILLTFYPHVPTLTDTFKGTSSVHHRCAPACFRIRTIACFGETPYFSNDLLNITINGKNTQTVQQTVDLDSNSVTLPHKDDSSSDSLRRSTKKFSRSDFFPFSLSSSSAFAYINEYSKEFRPRSSCMIDLPRLVERRIQRAVYGFLDALRMPRYPLINLTWWKKRQRELR